ncbi:hypothetical protein EK21DRAFT_107721 [Setomelanomma holmii]|uniref:Transmembrane protein n=1 Tax=Setomelanomma holmii TaxID=210430 RepID=A0A9P4HGI8_9PLEO|nr:hypothetical protein EK21DRAFT_107721 [Setomelanomma holmii]
MPSSSTSSQSSTSISIVTPPSPSLATTDPFPEVNNWLFAIDSSSSFTPDSVTSNENGAVTDTDLSPKAMRERELMNVLLEQLHRQHAADSQTKPNKTIVLYDPFVDIFMPIVTILLLLLALVALIVVGFRLWTPDPETNGVTTTTWHATSTLLLTTTVLVPTVYVHHSTSTSTTTTTATILSTLTPTIISTLTLEHPNPTTPTVATVTSTITSLPAPTEVPEDIIGKQAVSRAQEMCSIIMAARQSHIESELSAASSKASSA